MNPHRLSWGFAYNFPFAQVIALVTIASFVFCKEPKRFPLFPITVVWLVFLLWMGITTIFAEFPHLAIVQYEKIIKVQIIVLLTMFIMNTKERIIPLVWIIAFSIGFYGIKGGVFAILTGGTQRIWGPAGSFIADNNGLAQALLMIIPLMFFLRNTITNKWIRLGFIGLIILISISVLSSYSRGAMLGASCMALFLALKSNRKLLIFSFLPVLIAGLLTFMPQKWYDRMNTLQTYEEDGSAMGRIDNWKFAFHMANDRIFGGGLNVWGEASIFYQYEAEAREGAIPRAAHSIYFGILGEHGWIGLILFLIILFLAWRTGTWVIKRTKKREDLAWANELARMIQVSLIAFIVSGAFLNQQYFDLPWHIMSILVLVRVIVKNELEKPNTVEEEGGLPEVNAFGEERRI